MRLGIWVACACWLWISGCGLVGVASLDEADIRRAVTHRERAALKLSEGQLEMAIREYRNSVSINPYDPEAHFGLGETLRRKGRLDESETAFRAALELDPKLHDAELNLIVLHLQRERWQQAIDATTALLDDPTFLNPARGYINRGWAYHSLGDLERAEADFREAIGIDSSLYHAHLNLGIVLYAQGELPESLQAFERVLEIVQGHLPSVEAETRFRIAQARVKLGQREAAVSELRAASDRGGRGSWGVKAREYLSVLE